MTKLRALLCFLGMIALVIVLVACLMAIPRAATGNPYCPPNPSECG